MNVEELTLISGVGDYGAKQACIMSAAVAKHRLAKGEALGQATDRLECVCPVIRYFAVRVNDAAWWKDDAERTTVLMPFVDRILDTADESKSRLRMFMVADAAVRSFAPVALDVIGHKEDLEKLRTLAPIVDRGTALAARDAAREARKNVVAAADAAAEAAAYAAAAAAAAAAAYAAADAAAYAVADAAAYAVADAAAYAVAKAAAEAAAAAAAAAAADAAAYAVAAAAADAAAYAAAAANHWGGYHDAKLPARNAALELLGRLCEV